MRFRRRRPGGFDRASLLLEPRSIYHLTGEARHEWEHGITPIEAARWSITFRSLSEKGRVARDALVIDIQRGGHGLPPNPSVPRLDRQSIGATC